jgi:hypothetical protein
MKALKSTLVFSVRVVSTIVLFCVAGFCVFGFLASFEPNNRVLWNGLLWKVGYGALGCGCLISAIRLWLWRLKPGKSIIAGVVFLWATLH